MGMITYVVTVPSTTKEFLDQVFEAGRHYKDMAVTARTELDEFTLRRLGLQDAPTVRDFKFRVEGIQPTPSHFFVTAQEVTEDGTGAALFIEIDSSGRVIISMVAGEPRA